MQEFNRGVFDYLIATDESGLEGHDRDENVAEEVEETTGPTLISTQAAGETTVEGLEEAGEEVLPPISKKRKRKEASIKASTTEYGVSRGIDFVDVAAVINFDLPFSSRSYTHRVGRTARAGRTGTSLSFIVPKELWGKKKVNDISLETAKRDEAVWVRIERDQKAKGGELKEYKFDLKQVEGFRYRMEDGLRAVTKAAVREARIKEIKNEVVNSEKLKVRISALVQGSSLLLVRHRSLTLPPQAHFEDNPRDLAFLRHDKPLHPARVQPHLKHVPGYLMPRIAAVGSAEGPSSSASTLDPKPEGSTTEMRVPFHKPGRGGARGRGGRGGTRGGGSARGGTARGGKRNDPLKGGKFSFGGK